MNKSSCHGRHKRLERRMVLAQAWWTVAGQTEAAARATFYSE
jgi:hypothetical protein